MFYPYIKLKDLIIIQPASSLLDKISVKHMLAIKIITWKNRDLIHLAWGELGNTH